MNDSDLLKRFAEEFRSGAQGATMDCDTAQALAEAIDRQQIQLNWLRWGLEELVRCTEPKAGSGDRFVCGIAEEALQGAGFTAALAGIQKPVKK